jgi:hypothetical protein
VNALVAAGIVSFAQALGVECLHCHIENDWRDASKVSYQTARKMSEMVETLNAGPLAALKRVECGTCHAGQPQPARLPVASWRAVQDAWPASLPDSSDQLKLAMSVYSASLGVACVYCHTPDAWQSDAKAPFRMVARMNAMFELFPSFMPPTARTQCFMCHKGATSPSPRTP